MTIAVLDAPVVLDATASQFRFTVKEITGRSRRRGLVYARHMGMYAMREVAGCSYPSIARVFGRQDHTTAMHAIDKIGRLLSEPGPQGRVARMHLAELTRAIRVYALAAGNKQLAGRVSQRLEDMPM